MNRGIASLAAAAICLTPLPASAHTMLVEHAGHGDIFALSGVAVLSLLACLVVRVAAAARRR